MDKQPATEPSGLSHTCRWTTRVPVIVVVVFVVVQFVYGLSLHHRWLGAVGMVERVVNVSSSRKEWFNQHVESRLENCPSVPPKLSGPIPVNTVERNWTAITRENSNVEPGGLWRPRDCMARHHVAIVVPYRDREWQLKVFVGHMHKFLEKQQLNYGIYIVEEALPTRFNRAMLMNIGYAEASKQANYSCYIFHDVDLLPEDDRNIYSCPDQPRHMSVAVDKFKYKLPYGRLLGGVCALRTDHFKKINGFSNKFFGWGGEDDDFYNRVTFHKLKVKRYPIDIARYKMMRHGRDKLNRPNSTRTDYLLRTSKERLATDGLNSLKYKLLDLKKKPLYTWIYVNIEQ